MGEDGREMVINCRYCTAWRYLGRFTMEQVEHATASYLLHLVADHWLIMAEQRSMVDTASWRVN